MKKYLTSAFIITLVPCVCTAATDRVAQLMREKQQKMEQLEKCTGSAKGLMIAGVSTLGLTAVGVAGNIAEASVIKKYDQQIEATDKKIAKTEQEIEDKKQRNLEREIRAEEREKAIQEEERQKHLLINVARQDLEVMRATPAKPGARLVTHGYEMEELPSDIRQEMAMVVADFMKGCWALKEDASSGIADVNLSPEGMKDAGYYESISSRPADYELTDLSEHEIAICKVTAVKAGFILNADGTVSAANIGLKAANVEKENIVMTTGSGAGGTKNTKSSDTAKTDTAKGSKIKEKSNDSESAKATENKEDIKTGAGSDETKSKGAEQGSAKVVSQEGQAKSKKDVKTSSGEVSAAALDVNSMVKGGIKRAQTIDDNTFAGIQVSTVQGKALVNLLASKNGQSLKYESVTTGIFEDNKLVYTDKSNGDTIVFHFEDLTEHSQGTRKRSVFRAVCNIMGGSYYGPNGYNTEHKCSMGDADRCKLFQDEFKKIYTEQSVYMPGCAFSD